MEIRRAEIQKSEPPIIHVIVIPYHRERIG